MFKNIQSSFLLLLLLILSIFGEVEFLYASNRIVTSRGAKLESLSHVMHFTEEKHPINGMCRVVLEKNMVKGINLLTQGMLSQDNTIYIIRYDFDLNHNLAGEVTVPENCCLQFDGGSISNGTIIGQDTEILAGLVKIFNTDVTLAGSWKNNGHIRWFGADPGNSDNTDAIQKCLDCFEVVEMDNATYRTDALNMNKCRVLKGIKAPRGEMSTLSFSFGGQLKTGLSVLYYNSYPYIEIEGVSFILSGSEESVKNTIAIDLSTSTSAEPKFYSVPIKCNGCVFNNFDIGIKSNYRSYYNYIDDCVFKKVNQCLRDFSSNNLIVTKSYASYFFHFAYGVMGNGPVTLRECSFELFTGGIVFSNVGDIGVLNFIDNYVETERGNIFQGFCSSLVSIGNSIQMDNDVDCLYYPYNIVSFVSTGNYITNREGFRVNSSTGKYDFKYFKYYNTGGSKLKSFVSLDVVHTNKNFDKNKYIGGLKLDGNKVSVIGYEPFTGDVLTK